MENDMLGYPVLIVEYERGWGSKPDGYLVFDSEERRAAYLRKEYASREGPPPEFYIGYTSKPAIDILPESESKFNNEGYFYVEKLIERRSAA